MSPINKFIQFSVFLIFDSPLLNDWNNNNGVNRMLSNQAIHSYFL